MVPLDKLAQITRRFDFLEAKLSAGIAYGEIASLSREYSDLKPVAAEIPRASITPDSTPPIRPGPDVTATASRSARPIPAAAKARSTQ